MADQPRPLRGSHPVPLRGTGTGRPGTPVPVAVGGIMRPRLAIIDYIPAPNPDQSRLGVKIMGHPGHRTSTPSITNPEGVPSIRVPGPSKSDPAIDVHNLAILSYLRKKPSRSISSIPEQFFVRPSFAPPVRKLDGSTGTIVRKLEGPAGTVRKPESSVGTRLKTVEPPSATHLKKPEPPTTTHVRNQGASPVPVTPQAHTIAVPMELTDLFKRWRVWDREPEKPEYPWRDDRTDEEKIIPEPDYFCCPYSRYRTHSWLVRTPRPIPPTTVGPPPIRGQPSNRGRRRGHSKRKLVVHDLEELVKYSFDE